MKSNVSRASLYRKFSEGNIQSFFTSLKDHLIENRLDNTLSSILADMVMTSYLAHRPYINQRKIQV